MVPGMRGMLGGALAVVMLAIVVIDTRHFIIPDELTAAGLLLGIIHAVVATSNSTSWALASAALRGAILALAFLGLRAAYQRLRGREGLGWGDVKLAGVAGVWLDWVTLPLAIEIAALGAIAAYVSRQYIRRRPLRLESRLPFGAFLAPSIWLGWLLETSLLGPFH